MSVKVPKLRPGEVLVLRGCEERDGKLYGHGGFVWPRKGRVSAPDWSPGPECGGGLHGLLRGCGDAGLLTDGVYLLVAVQAAGVVALGGKCKFPRGRVVFAGSRDDAVAILAEVYPNAPGVYRTATAGDEGTATAGYRGELRIRWHDGARFRCAVGYVGEDGILPNVAYVVRGGKIARKNGGA